MRVAFPGMVGGLPSSPYAISGGIVIILLPPTFSTFDFLGPLTFVMSSFDLSAHSTVEDQLVQHLIVKFEKLTTEDQAPIVARNAARAIVALGVTDVQVRFQFLPTVSDLVLGVRADQRHHDVGLVL